MTQLFRTFVPIIKYVKIGPTHILPETHHTCLYLESIHQMVPPLSTDCVADIQLQLTIHLSTRKDERLMSWPGWLTYSGGFTRQLQVERRTGKVRRSETNILPLCHARNQPSETQISTCSQTNHSNYGTILYRFLHSQIGRKSRNLCIPSRGRISQQWLIGLE